jgi:tRNA pseudouridine55 synthase
VRSLAHDLGRAVGTGAILDALVRTEAAGFGLGRAVPFETLVRAPRAELRDRILPMETLLTTIPAVQLTEEGVHWARHGRELGPQQMIRPILPVPALVRLFTPDGRLAGLADRGKLPGFLHPAVIFSYN